MGSNPFRVAFFSIKIDEDPQVHFFALPLKSKAHKR